MGGGMFWVETAEEIPVEVNQLVCSANEFSFADFESRTKKKELITYSALSN